MKKVKQAEEMLLSAEHSGNQIGTRHLKQKESILSFWGETSRTFFIFVRKGLLDIPVPIFSLPFAHVVSVTLPQDRCWQTEKQEP